MKKIRYKYFLYISLLILIVVILFQIYVYFFNKKICDLNGENIKNIKNTIKKDNFNIAVIGGISNNNYIWDDFLQKVKQYDIDFVISLGDFVFESSEANYRQFLGMLKKLDIPFVSAIGENEYNNRREIKFINYFGPEFFSFEINNNLFIFLDTTKDKILQSQKNFLESILNNKTIYYHKFIFLNKAPFPLDISVKEFEDYYIKNKSDQKYLKNFIEKNKIDAVFFSSIPVYYYKRINGISYFISGGGGRPLISNNKSSFYHFILFSISEYKFNVKPIELIPVQKSLIKKILMSIWFTLTSYLYVNMFNLIMILALVFFIYSYIYLKLSEDVDYYSNFMIDYSKLPDKKYYSIAMFTDSYFPAIGGVPISIYTLVNALIKRGHIVYIFAPEYNQKDFKNYNDPDFVIRIPTLVNYKKRGKTIPVANIFSPKIKEKIKQLDIDIIHTHHPFWVGFKGNIIAKSLKLPSIYTYHTRYEKYSHNLPSFLQNLLGNRLTHWFIKYFSQRNDAIFAPTPDVKKYLRSIGVSKEVFVVPTGISLKKFNAINKKEIVELRDKIVENKTDKIILFTVSRLDKEKNIYFILNTISYLKEKSLTNFVLLVSGDGPEKSNLIKFVKKHNLENFVKFLGLIYNSDLPKYYKIADIFVFASKTETQGIVLLEAMAAQTPVVCIKSSGTNDLVENDFNGYKTEENIVEYSEKIILLMKDKGLRNRLAKNAYKFVHEFTDDKMAQKALEVYNNLYKRKVFVQKLLKKDNN